ncbi:MAG TPA: (Fe-S)-binding protein [Symbiobacteriaceae bacterium]|nr:(Fe-S)-binding protein [Symbiobacteriaceae bacterium]
MGLDLLHYESLNACITCGRCLPACPTYELTLKETQSPRGRLALVKALGDGELAFSPGLEEQLYHCLDCRACNTVCPAGLPIGQAIIAARAEFGAVRGLPWYKRLALNCLFASHKRVEAAAWLLRAYQKLGLSRVIRPLLKLLPKRYQTLAVMEGMLPVLPMPLRRSLPEVTPPPGGAVRLRVGFFLGCVMNVVFAEASRSTVRVLGELGCEVITPREQVCCGAPHDDQGNREMLRTFARRNIDVFLALNVDYIVADCAACSGMTKEYAHLLHDDPAYADRARQFSAKMLDISEFLARFMPDHLQLGALDHAVTYHDPCHLANVQGVRAQPRSLLNRIPGLDFRPMERSGWCCGSAGLYTITHTETSLKLLDGKMRNVAATGAPVVVSGNPGCMLQIAMGAQMKGMPVQVRHLTQVLDESISRGKASERGCESWQRPS